MDKFIQVQIDLQKEGTAEGKVYINSQYQVILRKGGELHGLPEIVWLSIKRRDKEPIHDWRDLQEIKNQLVGEECEGMEIYPAESRKADSANQYHLWVFSDPAFRIPVGFDTRFVLDDQTAEMGGAKQRPFKKGEK